MDSKKPNVIVFFTDQQRWDTSGLHGNPLGLMPNFDRLAQSGTHIAESITCQPVCGPARSCLQTGQYATTTGVWRNAKAIDPDANTLAKNFRAAGYATGYFGKWHLAPGKKEEGGGKGPVAEKYRAGYDFWLAANVQESTSDPYRTIVYDNEGKEVFLPGYRVDAQTDAMIRYIHEHKDEPFFLFQSFLEPHHQNRFDDYPPPMGYREPYASRWVPPDLAALGGTAHQHLGGYYGMVKRLDEALGRLMDALESLGLTENTIVLFTSDHACHFKTRNSEYKRSCHESSVRVPTMLTGGPFTGGGQVQQQVSLVDLPPTLLDAAGLEVPESMEGRSILPLVRNPKAEWPSDVFIQISESQVGRAIRTKRWKLSVVAPDKDGWNDSASDKYVVEFLYDLASDPYELDNLAGRTSHRALEEKLVARLKQRIREVEGMEVEVEFAPEVKSGQRSLLPHEMEF